MIAASYDDLGRRTGITRGNRVTTAYGYDAASRLNSLSQDLAGAGRDQTLSFTHNDRRWLVADQLGSVIAVTNGTGAATVTNTYDEYGQPGTSNAGRFQYTGQTWLPEVELYH